MCNEFFGISLYVGALCSDFSMFDNWTALGVMGMKVNSDWAMTNLSPKRLGIRYIFYHHRSAYFKAAVCQGVY